MELAHIEILVVLQECTGRDLVILTSSELVHILDSFLRNTSEQNTHIRNSREPSPRNRTLVPGLGSRKKETTQDLGLSLCLPLPDETTLILADTDLGRFRVGRGGIAALEVNKVEPAVRRPRGPKPCLGSRDLEAADKPLQVKLCRRPYLVDVVTHLSMAC